jgi:hypothetical protein
MPAAPLGALASTTAPQAPEQNSETSRYYYLSTPLGPAGGSDDAPRNLTTPAGQKQGFDTFRYHAANTNEFCFRAATKVGRRRSKTKF